MLDREREMVQEYCGVSLLVELPGAKKNLLSDAPPDVNHA